MKKIIIILLFVIGIVVLVCVIPFRTAIVFYQDRSQDIVAYVALTSAQHFQIQYTHSIHLSSVVETYEATSSNEIRQIELMYEDMSIGMPSDASGGEQFVQEDGKYYIKNMNRLFPYIYLRVGEVKANHTLIIGDKMIPMITFTEPGSVIRIQIEKRSMFDQWRGVNLSE